MQAGTDHERLRMESCFMQRLRQSARASTATTSQMPSDKDLYRATLFLDSAWPSPPLLVGYMGMCVFKLAFVDSPHVASAHVSQNPWPPQDQLVAWGVDFAGAWVITPNFICDGHGACLKLASALSTPCKLWVDQAVRDLHSEFRALLLEVVKKHMLPSGRYCHQLRHGLRPKAGTSQPRFEV